MPSLLLLIVFPLIVGVPAGTVMPVWLLLMVLPVMAGPAVAVLEVRMPEPPSPYVIRDDVVADRRASGGYGYSVIASGDGVARNYRITASDSNSVARVHALDNGERGVFDDRVCAERDALRRAYAVFPV